MSAPDVTDQSVKNGSLPMLLIMFILFLSGDPPPVFVGLAAGTSANGGVRGLDLHMLHHIIVAGHLDGNPLTQLVGRGVRIGQQARLQVSDSYLVLGCDPSRPFRVGS